MSVKMIRRKTCLQLLLHIALMIKKGSCGVHQRTDANGIVETYLDDDWKARAQAALEQELTKTHNTNKARNVIYFIGDGLGITATTVSRIYRGQKEGTVGELVSLSFEKFPHVGLSKTYSNNLQVTESAAAAVALLSGVKATAATLGCGPELVRGNCSQVEETKIPSILHWAMDAGKATGVIATTRITHATPAAAYAHSADRDWESDADLPDEVKGQCTDIAHQLIMDNPDINVIMGGGRRNFFPTTKVDPEDTGKTGRREDGLDLVKAWKNDKHQRNKKSKYVWKKSMFTDIDTATTDYVLGLFDHSHMEYELNRPNDAAGEPSLAEMTQTAIEILARQPNGYFLVIEAGRIDHAHHENYVKLALEDTLAFDDAVAMAVAMTDESDTLIVVTADHSHPLAMGSFASINNPILGAVDDFGFNIDPTDDGDPYLGLAYGNGPGPQERINVTASDTTADDFRFPAGLGMPYSTHGGEDVAIYAVGPWSHLMNGVQDNHYIPYAIAYAACIGDYQGC